MSFRGISQNGKDIKSLRKKHNLTQAQFAEKLGVTRQAINNYETGYRIPPKTMMMHVIKVFGELKKTKVKT